MADAFLDVAVRDEHVDVVVEGAVTLGGVGGSSRPTFAPGGHGHADRIGQALAQRAGGGLHARGQAVFRVPRGQAAPLPVAPQVIQGQPVAGQVELDVQGQAGMPAGQDETVPAEPVRVGRVMPEHMLVQQVGDGGQAHRRARMAGARFLHGIHGQNPDQVDGALVGLGPLQRGGSPLSSSRPNSPT